MAQEVLSPEEISKLIPDKIKGYYQPVDAQSKLMRLGTIRYSLVEKKFKSNDGRQEIRFLLFDYKEAPIMFNQATRKWSAYEPVESDSLILQSVVRENCTGWETHQVTRHTSQIMMGICERFFLLVDARDLPREALRDIMAQIRFESYPK